MPTRLLTTGAMGLLLTAIIWGQDSAVPSIPGVVAAGTPIELVQEGFSFTEGPVGTQDGGLFFTDTQGKPTRIFRMEPGGTVRALAETQGMNGLAVDAAGQLFGAEMYAKRIVRLDSAGNVVATVTAGTPEHPIVQPNDLIVDARGGIYFTDPGTFDPKSTAVPHVYYVRPTGGLHLVTDQIPLPNGLTLTPDGRALLVADTKGEELSAFDVRADGTTGPRRVFARLTGIPAGQNSGADGMTVDSEGRVYVTSRTGIQVLSPTGGHLGTIVAPRPAANVAFSGPGKQYLYIAARQGLYRMRMLAHGVARPGK
ncbi:MAG: SMP-30/gluconolactonase/LRE family protein [Vicinamibacterales bacterium]